MEATSLQLSYKDVKRLPRYMLTLCINQVFNSQYSEGPHQLQLELGAGLSSRVLPD